MNHDDPRARRTRTGLRTAVLDLVTEREPAAITLSDVATRAGVNRATVYQHYPDLDALLVDAMEDTVSAVAHAARSCPLDAPADAAPRPLVDLFEHVDAHAARYARMLGPHGSAGFAVRMREALAEALLGRFRDGARPAGFADVPAEVHATYLAGALTAVIATWVATPGGRRPSPAAQAAVTWRLLYPRDLPARYSTAVAAGPKVEPERR